MNQIEVLTSPVKSQGDKKDYRLIKLPNGLKALLISKKGEESSFKSDDKAAACLAVQVGTFDDPKTAMGLAHFLEHILFLGSEKYPQENSFNDFLVANGGNDNAETSSECTKFYFNIADKVFPKAIDMFAQQFIAPLLKKEAMQREREAVDSEFQMAASQDQLLIENVYKSLISDSHPASQFDVGNLKTLKANISDDDLHAELLKLHSKYVANKMCLAVQSMRSLDELQELVAATFSAIKSSSGEPDEKPEMSVDEIFKPEFFDKIYFMKPKSSKKSLHLTWALPSVHKHYKSAPLAYISEIFLNEREGGIVAHLREKRFMSSLQSYTHVNDFGGNSRYCMPRLIIGLTDLGYENLSEVLASVFSYLLMMKESPMEEHRRLFNDIKDKSETHFRWHREATALTNVKDAITPMILYEEEDILRGHSVFKEFNEQIIGDAISSLNQLRFNLLILDNDHESYNKTEKYFGTQYDERDFPIGYRTLWNERKPNPAFFLEKTNPFKVTNFEIFVNEAESPTYPEKILDDSVYEVWHKLDKTHNLPRATVHVYMLAPDRMTSIQSDLHLSIYDSMLTRHLKKITSSAKSAGLGFGTRNDYKAFNLAFSGFNDKMETFVSQIFDAMFDFNENLDELVFDLVKTQFKKNYRNSLQESKYLNDEIFYKIIRKSYFTDVELHDEIDDISSASLQKFVREFFQKMKIQILVQGNMTRSQALNIVEILKTRIVCEPLDETFELKKRSYALPLGSSVVRAHSLMQNNDNSKTNVFYQVLDASLRSRSLCHLIAAILNPKAFFYLRNQKQLGYSVGVHQLRAVGLLGINVHVSSQEGKHLFSEVQSEIEYFVNEVARKAIEDLTDEEFESFKESRIKSLLVSFSSAENEANANWKEITQQDYIFDRYELAAEAIKDLTKRELQEFFASITRENARKLCVTVIGNTVKSDRSNDLKIELVSEKIADDEKLITDIEEFRNQLVLQPMETPLGN